MTPMRESLKIIPERTFFVCAKSPDEDGKKMHKNCNHQNCRRQEFEIYRAFRDRGMKCINTCGGN